MSITALVVLLFCIIALLYPVTNQMAMCPETLSLREFQPLISNLRRYLYCVSSNQIALSDTSRSNMTVPLYDLDDPMTHPSGPLFQF